MHMYHTWAIGRGKGEERWRLMEAKREIEREREGSEGSTYSTYI